jgi:hypothetical protein
LQVVNTMNKVEPNWNIYEQIVKDAKGYLLIVVVGKYVMLEIINILLNLTCAAENE